MNQAGLARAKAPQDPLVLEVLAKVLIYRGEAPKAREVIETWRKLDPSSSPAQKGFLEGLAAWTTGDLATALARFEQVAALEPGHAELPPAYAVALHEAGKISEARAWLDTYFRQWQALRYPHESTEKISKE